jgi:hypothetical protein
VSDIVSRMREIMLQLGVSEDVATLVAAEMRHEFGGEEAYVPKRPKSRILAAIEHSPQASADEIARQLGVSARRVRQMRQLTGRKS